MNLNITAFFIAFLFFIFGGFISYLIKYNTIEWHAPSSSDVRRKVFFDKDNKKYRLNPVVYVCPIDISMK